MECLKLKIHFPGMVNSHLVCCSEIKHSTYIPNKSDCSCQPAIMCGSRVCNFSFLLFLTCLSTGRVSGQGRPGQEVVTFLPQGDILYEISTVYTNQNTEAIITVVANEMIKWSVRDSTVSTVGYPMLKPWYYRHDWLIVRCRLVDIQVYDFLRVTHRDPCCCLRSPIVQWPGVAGSCCVPLGLTPQLLCWPRGPEPWENEQIRAYTRHQHRNRQSQQKPVARNWMKL